jgi:hypothetical protein
MQGFAPNASGPNAYLGPAGGAVVTPQPDSIKPTIDGTLAYTKSASSITIDWSATTSSDNVGVARREYRIGGSGAYTPATSGEEASKSHAFTGLAASTLHQIDLRCVDTSGNVSDPLTISVQTDAAVVTPPTATAPGVPRNVVATAGINSISVAFLAPLSNGGAAVTGYAVRLSTGEQQTVAASPALFTGLSLVARTAQVAATNSVGPGSYSSASNTVTPTVVPPDPDPDPDPGDGFNYIRCTLATHDGVLHVSLAVLRWALFAQLSPAAFGAPVDQGTHTMPAGSAQLEIAVLAADVPAGWYMLVLADEDGTTAVACPILVGP